MAVEPASLRSRASVSITGFAAARASESMAPMGGSVTYGGSALGASAEPEVLEVRAGLLGRRTFLIAASEVAEIVPDERRLILAASPRLLGTERLNS
jgi:hypothetical protein